MLSVLQPLVGTATNREKMVRFLRETAKRIGPVRRAVIRGQMKRGVRGQSDEGEILRRLSDQKGTPKTFVEFGFHPAEYNCASLINDHQGLLIDGNDTLVSDARKLLPSNIRVEQQFLSLGNLDFIRQAFPELGILSVDVDGNDYWFLEALLDIEPSVIVVEYNSSFLHHSITVPYDPSFVREEKHSSGWYHGASLAALTKLVATRGYGLEAVSEAGGNAFFTKTGRLDPEKAWRPIRLRDGWSKTTAEQQWEQIRDMPFVEV